MKVPQPISKLLRVGALVYIAGSVIFTTYSYFVHYSLSDQTLRSKITPGPEQMVLGFESTVNSNHILSWKGIVS